MLYGEGSCCSKLSKCWKLREKDGGIYTKHMDIPLSRVTETAVACLFVCFVALRPKSTAMVIAGRSVHLTTLFPGQA